MYPIPRKNPDPKPYDLCTCGHMRKEHDYRRTVERHTKTEPNVMRAGDALLNTCGVYEAAPLGDLNCGCLAFDDPKEPKFHHDCDACEFLGRFKYDAPLADGTTTPLECDLWRCTSGPSRILGGSIIARFSSKGPDYASMARDILVTVLEDIKIRDRHSTYTPALAEGFERSRIAR